MILLIVGTVMDIFSAIVVVLPLLLPIAHAYHVDPYHLGVIFLLNLEVGYLHPPVGLNLFITSVKFQRPITEVMWATIPFLVTMIVALLVITYVPQITYLSTPEQARTEPIGNLARMVHVAAEELTVVKEVTLVDSAGNNLLDKTGKPIVKKIADCDAISDEIAKGGCQSLFFDVKACKGKPDEAPCANKAVASWVVGHTNQSDDPDVQIILVPELQLVCHDKPLGPIKKLADCAKSSDVDTCRELFVKASNCKILGDNIDGCIKGVIDDWVSSNMASDCP